MCNIIKKPSECSKEEKENFFTLVKKGDEVNIATLKDLIEKAALLAFHYEKENLVGIAALKHPNKSHKDGIFKNAGFPQESDKYVLEFGWAYTEPKCRGKHICSILAQKMLDAEVSQNIYATMRENNDTMQRILERKGFKKTGERFLSTKGYYLLLFTRAIS